MISKMKYMSLKQRFQRIYKEWQKQEIILKDGLNDYNIIILKILPFITTIFIMFFSYLVDLSLKKTLQNIIAIMPSLIGFLIASATIIISINNTNLNEKAINTPCSYKQIGGAVFFYATKIAFLLLIIAFLSPDKFPDVLSTYKPYILLIFQLFIYWLFSKFIIMVLYGLMHLTSSIEIDK